MCGGARSESRPCIAPISKSDVLSHPMDEGDVVADALTLQSSFVALTFQMPGFYVLPVHSVLNIVLLVVANYTWQIPTVELLLYTHVRTKLLHSSL